MLLKTILKTLFICTLSIFFTSCLSYYTPTPLNNPMLSNAKEAIVSGSLKLSDDSKIRSLNAAYSPSNNFGLQYSFHSINYKDNGISNLVGDYNLCKGTMNEIMAGYYKSTGTNGLFELYGGVGVGNSEYVYVIYFPNMMTDGSSKISLLRTSLMPSIGLKYKHFQISFGSKISRVDYYRTKIYDVTDSYTINELNSLRKSPNYFLDNALTIKIGSQRIKGFFQINNTNLISGNIYNYDPLQLYLGVQYQFLKL